MKLFKSKILKGSLALALSLMLAVPVMAATSVQGDMLDEEYETIKSAITYTFPNYVEKKDITVDLSWDDPEWDDYEAQLHETSAHVLKRAPNDYMLKVSIDANKFPKAHSVELIGEEYTYAKGVYPTLITAMNDRDEKVLTSNGSKKEAILSFSKFELGSTGDGKFLFMTCYFNDKDGNRVYNDDSLELIVLNEKGTETLQGQSSQNKPDLPAAKPAKKIAIQINGKTISSDVSPILENGSTFVPLRVISEYLGAQVNYESQTKPITLTKGDQVIELLIGSNQVTTNGIASELTSPTKSVNGTTFVPIRMIAETFNSLVDWDGDSDTVIISEK